MSNDKRLEAVRKIANVLTDDFARMLDNATRCCLNCEHFKEHEGEMCSLYNARPPARVITFGCPSYQDKVPF